MSLNIQVQADPESIHALADWLGQISGVVDDAAGDAGQSHQQSVGEWEGDTGEGFRAVAGQMRGDGQQLADGYTSAARVISEHAEAITAVRRNMDDTRDYARGEGLSCSETEIHSPGSPPWLPPPLQPGDSAGHSADKRAEWSTYLEWVRLARAYRQCEQRVQEAPSRRSRPTRMPWTASKGLSTSPTSSRPS